MFHYVDEQVVGFVARLSEPPSNFPRGVGRIFMRNPANISRGGVRYKLR